MNKTAFISSITCRILLLIVLIITSYSCTSDSEDDGIDTIPVATVTSISTTATTTREAEAFNKQQGTSVETTTDTGGGQNVRSIDTGDYLEYQLNVPEDGSYQFDFRVASTNDINFDFLFGGVIVENVGKLRTGGNQLWSTVSSTVAISQGIATLRINSKSNDWNFNWIKVKKLAVDTSPPTAADIIGGNWKLNAYSGTFNVNQTNNGLTYVDNASKAESAWFYAEDGYANFKCFPGNATSSGSSNPRTELRELSPEGNNIFWNGNTSALNSMKWKVRVDDLPASGKVCFGQIHERDSELDDTIRVQAEGTGGQTTGSARIRVMGYVTEVLLGGGQNLDFDFQLDTEYYFQITQQSGVIKFNVLNNDGSLLRNLFTSRSFSADENYFKAGAYLQSTRSDQFGSTQFGLVRIKEIDVSH